MAWGPREMTETEKVIREPMITIVEPKEAIAKLWGKQKVRESDTYRLMRYVLRVDHEGKVLLHNCVTGQLVVLDQEEADALEKLPTPYTPVMEQLVTEHYLVPETFDEHGQTVNLRNILWKMTEARQPKEVTSYMILPTTACNARCWYCFEKGVKPVTMTEETANDVVDFIERNCGGKPVYIWWFGGEPTLVTERIDQISIGLQKKGIRYYSDITTNGYLFDDEMVTKAKLLWHVHQVSVSLDGTEVNYNRTKSFFNVRGNPYKRMMDNVGKILDNGIPVVLRMNFDQNNYQDFSELLNEVKLRFPENAPIMVYPHQINKVYSEEEKPIAEAWFKEKNVELLLEACESGLYRKQAAKLPNLQYVPCGAANGRWVTIHPSGKLVCCSEQLTVDQYVGDLQHGVTNKLLLQEWKQFADYEKCVNCLLFPVCCRMVNCAVGDRCFNKERTMLEIEESVRDKVR